MSDLTIFDKDIFTLKEFCYFITNNIKNEYIINKYDNINNNYQYNNIMNNITNNKDDIINKAILENISNCYILFSSCNNDYRKFLNDTRIYKGFLLKKNNKNIYLREFLQIFDIEFTKLVIRIKTYPKDYDINISWEEIEEKICITKNDIMNILYFKK